MMAKRTPDWQRRWPDMNTMLQKQAADQLQADNDALKKAGNELAAAALHVVSNHDGLHRLMLATAEWAKAIANEGGRGKLHATSKESAP